MVEVLKERNPVDRRIESKIKDTGFLPYLTNRNPRYLEKLIMV